MFLDNETTMKSDKNNITAHTKKPAAAPGDVISIKGARVNNLKNISLTIPRGKLVVVTGLSGSGKSSLAFDTLYAEGQRRYVESLSAYARQFLGKMQKPEVDFIHGLPPAIAIEQKVNTRNPRSTVGTSTEIYDYMRLLFGRVGHTFSPVSGMEVRRHTVTDVVDASLTYPEGTRMAVVCALSIPEGRTLTQHLEILRKGGYSRLYRDGSFFDFDDVMADSGAATATPPYELLIDRTMVSREPDELTRLADSVGGGGGPAGHSGGHRPPPHRLGGDGLLRGARPDDPCGMGRRRAAPPRFLETFRGRRHNVHGAVGPPVQLQQPLRSMPHLRRIRPLPGYRRAAGDSKPGAVGIRRCRGSVAR